MSDEMKRYMDILKEHFDQGLKVLAEGLSVANDKLDRVIDITTDNTQRLDRLEVHVKVLKSDITSIKKEVGEIRSDLKEKDRQMKLLNKRMSTIELMK